MRGGSVGGFGGSEEGRNRRDRLMVGFWEVLGEIVEVESGIMELFLDRVNLEDWNSSLDSGLCFHCSLRTWGN